MSRRNAREAAMKLIYQMSINDGGHSDILDNFYENEEEDFSEEDRKYIDECTSGVKNNLDEINKYIEKYLKDWKINRISKVDLAIMRLAVFEMLQREDVPNVVAVNEALEIAKKFSSEKSTAFINGILGNVIRELNQNG